MQTQQIRLAARPHGEPTDDCFEHAEGTLSDLEADQVLLRTIYLSLDPYMRGRMSSAKSYAASLSIGDVLMGATVCEVLESRHANIAVGDIVLSYSGWQTHAIAHGGQVRRLDPTSGPVSTALGVLGMPGFTAYAGLLEIGKPKPGETVVVAAATGPVGSAVGQIAKIKGARAVGIAGGPEKCKALIEEFGFDAAIDHRSENFDAELVAAVPDGVDVYFENVGGHVGAAVFEHLNTYARVPVCGLVASYNDTNEPEGSDRLPGFMRQMLSRSLTVRGFIQNEFEQAMTADFQREMSEWVCSGVVHYREDVVEGLENAPAAFRGMLRGKNFGKLIVQVGAEQVKR